MHRQWGALVGFAALTLLVNAAGPRLHLHPAQEDEHGPALVHSHGSGEPHSHGHRPARPDDEGERPNTVIVLGVARVLLPSSSAATLTAPVFLPEPVTTVVAAVVWTPAPDTTPVHSHGPPSVRRLPARAPPPDSPQHS